MQDAELRGEDAEARGEKEEVKNLWLIASFIIMYDDTIILLLSFLSLRISAPPRNSASCMIGKVYSKRIASKMRTCVARLAGRMAAKWEMMMDTIRPATTRGHGKTKLKE